MAEVLISGSVLLTGAVEWSSGAKTANGSIITEDMTFQGMAPVPIPPPNTGDPCPCSSPPADDVKNLMTPGSHTIGTKKMVVLGSMYMQSSGKPCQPMMAMSAETVINNTPVCVDPMMFMGMLNGAGAS